MKKRYLVIMLLILSIISLFLGAKDITLTQILNKDLESLNILFISRFPRLLSIILAGVGMSVCGLIMQSISQNKFVSPTTGATIDSAQLGIVFCMIFLPSASVMLKSFVAFIFALSGTFLFMTLLKKLQLKNVLFVPLIGIMLGNIIGAITTYFGYKYDIMQNINSWMQGSFSMILKGNYEILYISVPLVIIAIIYANKFTVAGMGEDFSTNLGLDYNKIVNLGLFIIALVTVSVIITAGNLPYIGLIVPNIVSLYKGDNLSENIFDTALIGASFVLLCDILSRLVIYPYEVSVGLTIGVIGSAVFLFMILGRELNEN